MNSPCSASGAQLFAQPLHVRCNGIGHRRTSPNGTADLFAAGDLAASPDQKDQQVEFTLGQLDVATLHSGLVSAPVDADGPGDEHRRLAGVGAAHERCDRGDLAGPGDDGGCLRGQCLRARSACSGAAPIRIGNSQRVHTVSASVSASTRLRHCTGIVEYPDRSRPAHHPW